MKTSSTTEHGSDFRFSAIPSAPTTYTWHCPLCHVQFIHRTKFDEFVGKLSFVHTDTHTLVVVTSINSTSRIMRKLCPATRFPVNRCHVHVRLRFGSHAPHTHIHTGVVSADTPDHRYHRTYAISTVLATPGMCMCPQNMENRASRVTLWWPVNQ